jgi:gas vesicle protein
MAQSDLRWVATAIMTGFLRRQQAHPGEDRPPQWVEAVTDVLNAAAARPDSDTQFHGILSQLQGLTTMSQTTQDVVQRIASAVASIKSEVQADVAAVASQISDLKKQVADAQAAGNNDPAMMASLESSANDLEATVKALHDGLNPPADSGSGATGTDPNAPSAVTFDSNDQTPNSAGGRNSSRLLDFDASKPETA